VFRRLAQPRTLLWPAAAAAVAVVIMLSDRHHAGPPAREVASAPRSGGGTASISAIEEPGDEPLAAAAQKAEETLSDATNAAAEALGHPPGSTPDEAVNPPSAARVAGNGASANPASEVPMADPKAEAVAISKAPNQDHVPGEPPTATSPAGDEPLVIRCRVDDLATGQETLAALLERHAGVKSVTSDDREEAGSGTATIETEISREQLAAVLAELKAAPKPFLAVVEPESLAAPAAEEQAGGQVAVRTRGGSGGATVGSGTGRATNSGGIRVRVRPDNPLDHPKATDQEPIRVRFVLEPGAAAPHEE
jgi:hypothetical protein